MYGKVSRSFFWFYIDHDVAAIYQFVEVRYPEMAEGLRGLGPAR